MGTVERAVRLVFALIALAGASVLSADAATKPKIHPECVRPSDHARMQFVAAADGGTLASVILGKGRTGVVLAHDFDGDADLCEWMPFARELARAGYRVLAFDFQRSGQSIEGKPTSEPFWPSNVADAAKAVRADGAKAIVLMGSSVGGWASLMATATLKPGPTGVMAVSTAANWFSRDATPVVATRPVPLLLIASKDDASVESDQRTLYLAAATKDKQRLLVPGGDHGLGLFSGPQRNRVRSAVLSFLRRHAA